MADTINFSPKIHKIIETILYLAHQGEFTRYQIVKFFYLADRRHLRKFGRPITFDHYVAMENGPVASIAYDIIKGQTTPYGVLIEELPFVLSEIEGHRGVSNPKRDVNSELFSKSDFKTLDAVVEEFGKSSFDELYDHTHAHEAYDKVWQNRKTNADPMAFEDFFENMENKESIVEELAFVARGM